LSETEAATKFAGLVATLRAQGVSIITYPVSLELVSPRVAGSGAFTLTITGPPGVYTISQSRDLETWNKVGPITNIFGSVVFTDATPLSAQKFYRAARNADAVVAHGPPFSSQKF